MFSTVFLCGVVTLLCLVAVNLAAYQHKLFRANRSRRLSLHRFFWAIGFLPVAIVTISNINFGNPVLLNFFAFFRNPFLTADLTFGAVAEAGEITFLMDFISAVLLSSTVVITLSRRTSVSEHSVHAELKKPACKSKPVFDYEETHEFARPYIRYCRILS